MATQEGEERPLSPGREAGDGEEKQTETTVTTVKYYIFCYHSHCICPKYLEAFMRN